MLTESGRVVAVEPDGLWVETIRSSTCGSCGARKGCGHGILNSMSDGRHGYVRVLPGEQGIAGCRVDDQVLFSLPEEVILRGSAIAYVLPLLCMMGSALAAARLFPAGQDAAAALGAVAGLCVGFILVRWHGHRHRGDPAFQPVLLRVLSSTPAGAQPL